MQVIRKIAYAPAPFGGQGWRKGGLYLLKKGFLQSKNRDEEGQISLKEKYQARKADQTPDPPSGLGTPRGEHVWFPLGLGLYQDKFLTV